MMQNVCNLEGKNPQTICGVAILLSKKVIHHEITIKEVAKATNKTENTLKSTLKIVEKDEELIIGKIGTAH